MYFSVRHSIPGRLRLGYDSSSVRPRQIALVQNLLEVQEGIEDVSFNILTSSLLIRYNTSLQTESSIKALVSVIDGKYLDDEEMLSAVVEPERPRSLVYELGEMVLSFYLRKLLPLPVRYVLRVKNLAPRILEGVKCLLSGNISDTRVLDATAIAVSLYTGDTATADNISFLLNVGETVEDYTKENSFRNLAKAMFNEKEPVQLVVNESEEKSVPLSLLRSGDTVVVRDGALIPCDGEVLRGEALVNQASITGEPLAVEKRRGSSVFAGTIVEEGEIYVLVRSVARESRVNSILSQIKDNRDLKVSSEIKSALLADRLVKYNFLLTGIVALTTRNLTKVVSTLMVDYSCAMKLIAPVAVLSAMKEAAYLGIAVKGGKYLELTSAADTLVMDKTGTLTQSEPRLSRIIAFGEEDERELLKLGACLEEHYVHPIAKAIVKAADERGIEHPEDHAKVEYIVAHGVASSVAGKRVLIGSGHFIFTDEHVPVPRGLREEQEYALEHGEGLLYLASDGALIGAFAVTDPVRPEAAQIIRSLRETGMKNFVMITGDEEGAAREVSRRAGIDRYLSRALPEDKVRLVRSLKDDGSRVIMIGDGINDAPALSVADVGIAMGESAAIAADTADIVLSSGDGLVSLYKTRLLGKRLVKRIDRENREIVVFNSALIVLGLLGILPPSSAALMHNLSTVVFSLEAVRPYLEEK